MTKTSVIFASVLLLLIASAVALIFATQNSDSIIETVTDDGSVRYLPLGDSYTIGQSVDNTMRWPNQLVTLLNTAGIKSSIIDNPAVTGYTTQDLIDTELPLVSRTNPDFVSVQIGVNDYVQGISPSIFQKNLEYIISQILSKMDSPKKIVLVTIPDFGKTTAGSQFGNPVDIEQGIIQFNQIITEVGTKNGIPVVDIFDISQKVTTDPTLTTNDGLHPSGSQYSLWAKRVFEATQANLR